MKLIKKCNLKSIKCRLFIVIVLSFFLPLLFFLCNFFIEYQDLRSDISTNLTFVSERYKDTIEDFISSEFSKLELIASLESVKGASPELESTLRAVKVAFPEVLSISYANILGQIVYSSNNVKGISVANMGYFIKAVKGERSVSGLLLSKIDGEKVIVFAVPVFSRQNFVTGVLISEIPIKVFYNLVIPLNNLMSKEGLNVRFALLDQNSNAIASIPSNSYQFTKNDFRNFLSNPINVFSLMFFDRWLSNEVSLAGTGWSVYCSIPSLSYFGIFKLTFFEIFVSLLILFLLSFISYFFVYKELAKPLKVLEELFSKQGESIKQICSINLNTFTLEFRELFSNVIKIWIELDQKDAKLEAANKELRAAEKRYRALVENSLTGIFMFAPDFTFRYVNVQFASIFGYSVEELLVKSPLDLFTQDGQEAIRSVITEEGTVKDDRFHSIVTGVHKNGTLLYIEMLLTYLLDDDGVYLFGTIADVSDKVAYQRNLEFLSYRDSLTGIYNRRFFEEELAKLSISKLKRKVAIVVVDIDCLKWANDRIGHAEGDNLIIRTARLLEDIFKEIGLVCRIGGDEFAIICIDFRNDELNFAIDRLKRSMGLTEGEHVPLYLSFGVASGHVPGDDLQEIFRRADDAMYLDKGSHHDVVYNVLKIYAKERGIES